MIANGRWLTVNDKSDKRWTQKPLIASTKEHNRHKVNPPLGFLHRHLFFSSDPPAYKQPGSIQ
jgi:hypothetical protein